MRNTVVTLVIINITIFLAQLVLGDWFTNSFMLVSKDLLSRPWILLTSMFLHGSIDHIFFNMYGLFIFGPFLEQRIGSKRFLFAYFVSGLAAGLFSSFFYNATLGASGAIMGIIGLLIVLLPNLRVLLFYIIPMPLWTAGIFWALFDVFGIFVPSGVANIAHLIGLGCGLAIGFLLKKEKVSGNGVI